MDETMAHIARAMRPERQTPVGPVLTAVGAVFGFAGGWIALQYLGAWGLVGALGMCAGALVGVAIARMASKRGNDRRTALRL